MNIRKTLLLAILPAFLFGSAFVLNANAEDGDTSTYEVTIPSEVTIDSTTKKGTLDISGSVKERHHQLSLSVSSQNDFKLVKDDDNKIAYVVKDGNNVIDNDTVMKFPSSIYDCESSDTTGTINKSLSLSISGPIGEMGDYSDKLTFTITDKNCYPFTIYSYVDGSHSGTLTLTTFNLNVDGQELKDLERLDVYAPEGSSYTISDVTSIDEDNYLYVGMTGSLSGIIGTTETAVQFNYVTKGNTVTFDSNGGTCSKASQKAAKGYAYGELPTPNYYGYKFDGWYTDKDGGTKVSSTDICNGDITLYAHWIALSLELQDGKTFYSNIPEEATSIAFVSDVAPVDATDLSASQDGSVLGWLDGTTWKVSSQTSERKIIFNKDSSKMFMSGSLQETTRFKSISFDNVDTSKVTNMDSMFLGCSNLTSLDLSNFDTFSVENMASMFYDCSNLSSLTLSSKFVTSNVTSMYLMFTGDSSLEELDLRSFDTSKVTDMRGMFSMDSKLSKIFVSDDFDVTSVRDSNNMFYGCNKLPNFNSSNIDKSMAKSVFQGGYLYVNIKIVNFDVNQEGATCDTTSMMVENGATYGDLPTPTHNSYEFAGWYTKPSDGQEVTSESTISTSDNEITLYAHWKTYTLLAGDKFNDELRSYSPRPTSVVFTSDTAPSTATLKVLSTGTSPSVYGWYDKDSITYYVSTQNKDKKIIFNEDSSGMFKSQYSLNVSSITFDNIDTSKVTNMSEMFSNNTSLTELDLRAFDTANVENMGSMFNYCTALTKIDLSSFNTYKVKDMSKMFNYCTSLTGIFVSSDKFDVSNVTSSSEIFWECNNLPNYEPSGTYADRGISRAKSSRNNGYLYVDASVITLDGNAEGVLYYDSSTGKTKSLPMTIIVQKGYSYKDMPTNIYRSLNGDYDNYVFEGYWTDAESGTEVTNDTIVDYVGDRTIYAHWACYKLVDGKTFNSYIPSNATSIEFTDESAPEGVTLTDLSIKQVNYVVGWFDESTLTYYVSTQKSGRSVVFNEDSSEMFKDKTALTSIDLAKTDTSQVTNMSSMFENVLVTSLDVSGFDTKKVTNMANMFKGCKNLTTLNLNSFKTTGVTDMSSMFESDVTLQSIYVSSNFSTAKVTNSTNMFLDCTSLAHYSNEDVDATMVKKFGEGGYVYIDARTLYFDAKDGDCAISSMSVESGYAIGKYGTLPTPTRSGYNFDYWYYNTYPITKITEDYVYNAGYDMTIFAKWTEWSYTLQSGLDFNKNIPDSATSIIFTTNAAPEGASLTSLNDEGSIVGWLDGTTYYVSSQNSDKKIVFNADSSSMFANKTKLTSIEFGDSVIDTSKVTDMSSMFMNCSKLTSIDVSSISSSTVTNMSNMFKDCTSLTSLELSNLNTKKVTNMTSMFEGDSNLASIYVGSSFSTYSVTDSTDMFKGCLKLPNYSADTVDASKAVSSMSNDKGYLYVNAKTIYFDANGGTCSVVSKQVEQGQKYGELPTATTTMTGYGFAGWYTSKDTTDEDDKITSDSYFYESSLDDTLTLYAHWETTYMLTDGVSFKTMIPDEATSIIFTSEKAPVGVTTTNLSTVENGSIVAWLDGTTWKVSSEDASQKIVFNPECYYMFAKGFDYDSETASTNNLVSITFNNIDTSKVTDMSGMFVLCQNLTSVNIDAFDTSNVTSMEAMFYGCSSLTNLDLSNFNTSKVTDMSFIFYGCASLQTLDLSSFDTSSVTSFRYMFTNCSALTKVYVKFQDDFERIKAGANPDAAILFYLKDSDTPLTSTSTEPEDDSSNQNEASIVTASEETSDVGQNDTSNSVTEQIEETSNFKEESNELTSEAEVLTDEKEVTTTSIDSCEQLEN